MNRNAINAERHDRLTLITRVAPTPPRAALALALIVLAGCDGQRYSFPIVAPPVMDRPDVIMETLADVTARDAYLGEQGKGYAHVCPGADRGNESRSFQIVVNGFSLGAVDRQPADGELESFCDAHDDEANYHLIMTRWSTGADYIQRNAGFIRALIELVNEKYEISDEDRVAVIGLSMGGVVSRYALQSMESESVPHNVDLFVSVDAPQQGAYVPIGAQHIANLFKDDGAGALIEELDSPASRQLLIYHYSRGDSPQPWTDEHGSLFFGELQGALGGFLQTDGLRTVAVSSGRADGVVEQPLPGWQYFGGIRLEKQVTGTETHPLDVFSCPRNLTFTVTIEVYIVARAWALANRTGDMKTPAIVATTRIHTDVNGINIDDRNALIDHFGPIARNQVNRICRLGITDSVVGRVVDSAISDGREREADRIAKYDNKRFESAASNVLSEGISGGLGDHIGQMRDEMAANGFNFFALDPAIEAKSTNVFIPRASALMLTGVGPTESLTTEMMEAASPFDKIYIEESTNLGHLSSTTGWYEQEVTALFESE